MEGNSAIYLSNDMGYVTPARKMISLFGGATSGMILIKEGGGGGGSNPFD